jgi:hypothetical protein
MCVLNIDTKIVTCSGCGAARHCGVEGSFQNGSMSFSPIVQGMSCAFLFILCAYLLRFRIDIGLRISYIHPFSVYLSYTHDPLVISCSRVLLRFHIPWPSNRRWATLTVLNIKVQDAESCVSIARVNVTLWLFPGVFRATSALGPSWISAELEDFRLHVFTSSAAPEWVETMRKDLMSTVLLGEQLYLHNIRTGVIFGSPVGSIGEPDFGERKVDDEIKLSVSLEDYQVRNSQATLYSFGKLDGLLTKSWVDGRGSLVLIARNSKRVKVHSLPDCQSSMQWLWCGNDLLI